jgi:undecaprenyl-diphosphatase
VSGPEALLLGLVQGLTEFLPVSSSGHLVIVQALLGVAEAGVVFEVALHLATLGSVLVFYRKRVAGLALGVLARRPEELGYAGKLVVATLPAVVLVLLAGDFLEAQFESARVAGGGLLFTGAVLWTTRSTVASARRPAPGWTAALLIGCAQALAIVPGVSRSGTTVAAALALGVAPAAAAEFSFLMSVVAIAGASLRAVPELSQASPEHLAAIALGGGVALVTGVAAIWAFLRLLRTRAFHRFALYVWVVGLLTLFLAPR